MALLWVVCGAGHGADQAGFARGLCELLPDAAHARHGGDEPQTGGPTEILHDLPAVEGFLLRSARRHHVVVESDTLALEGRGDVVIFVAGPPCDQPRGGEADPLRQAAHIVLAQDQPIDAWRKILEARLGVGPRATAAMHLLLEQASRLPAPPLGTGTKLWLAMPGGHTMGKGLAQLLGQVQTHATLRKASQATGISYRHAWDLIRTAERHLGAPLIISRPGGAGGGGTSLTVLGLKLLGCYQTLDHELSEFAERRLQELLEAEPSV